MYYSGHYILFTRRSAHCNNNNMETRLAQHMSTIQIKEDGKQHKFFLLVIITPGFCLLLNCFCFSARNFC